MKLNPDMLDAMRKAASLLQNARPHDATRKIVRVLQRVLPGATTATSTAVQPPPMKDINPLPPGLSRNPAAQEAAPHVPSAARQPAGVPDFAADLLNRFGTPGVARAPDVGASQAPAYSGVPAGQFLSGSITNAAGTRQYKLYVPQAYQGQKLPLVVMLHGCTQNPDDFAAGTEMNQQAELTSCLVLYPAQSRGANSAKCWNWFNAIDQQRERGEPSILADMTREIIATYAIEPSQVYVAGLSAGGAMAAILGHAYPELYAAVGIHSGLPYAAANDLSSALQAMRAGASAARSAPLVGASRPIIVFHGDRDHTVHPRNGEQLIAQHVSADALVSVEQGSIAGGHKFTRTLHRNRAGAAVAEQWLIHGAGHAWSGGSSNGSYTDRHGPHATREMMRFFATRRD